LADPAGWGGLFHPEDRSVFFDFIGRILSIAYMGSVECRTFHKEGYERWVRIFARPELDRENKITGIVGAVKDISESKKAEKALLEVNSNLEAKVKERTRELLESRDQLRELTRQIVSAQENERHRISRELHDEAGQALVGLRFSLDSAYREMPKGYPKIRKRMKQSLTLVDQTLSRLRNLAYELRPPMLDLMGIYLSIKQLCQDFSEQTGIRVRYSGCVLDGLEDEISISLYRFVQEALTNAAKHARATKIQVVLNYLDGVIVASVRDDGQGISETWEPGLGLTGIKERFDFLGGQLEIGPGMPKGTLIQIRLPWKEGVSFS
jgi:signal transduction histidine kinase